MKTVKINLYSFSELSEKSQKKAIEKLSDINIDYDYWDFVYEDFQQLASYFGMDVDTDKTYFSGFYSQGDGSAFTATVDPCKLIACIQGNTWAEYAPKENFNLPVLSVNVLRVCKLIAAGKIDFTANVYPANRETAVKVEFEFDNLPNNLNDAAGELCEVIEEVSDTLNKWLFRQLQKEYEYQTSEEAIKETIAANDYLFFENGKLIPVTMYPAAKRNILHDVKSKIRAILDNARARFAPVDIILMSPAIAAIVYALNAAN